MAGRDNRAAVFDLVRSAGTVSRVKLAQHSGLTEASVSRIVKSLLDEGIVVETGHGVSTGGKRPTLLTLSPRARQAAGVYLSDYQVRIVIADLAGDVLLTRILGRGRMTSGRQDLVLAVASALDDMLVEIKVDRAALLGVGVASPGRAETIRRGLTDDLEWTWLAIERDLAAASGLFVLVENDATCAALGEYWASRTPASRDLGVVTVAGGIGFGLVTGGDVYRGASSNAGELGHVSVGFDGPDCYCGAKGCLELFASPGSMVKAALSQPELAERIGLTAAKLDTGEAFDRIARAAVAGDEGAHRVVVAAARALGAAIVSVTNVMDLDQVVLTGPTLDVIGSIFVKEVDDVVRRTAFARDAHLIQVRLASSGDDVAAVGAATLIVHHLLGRGTGPRTLITPLQAPAPMSRKTS